MMGGMGGESGMGMGGMGGANGANGTNGIEVASTFSQAHYVFSNNKTAPVPASAAANPFSMSLDIPWSATAPAAAPAPQPSSPTPVAPSSQMPSALSPRNGRNLQADFTSAPAPASAATDKQNLAAAEALAAKLKNSSLGASFVSATRSSNSDKVPSISSNGSFVALAKSGFVLGMAAGQISNAGAFPRGASGASIVMTTSTRNGSVEMVSYGKAPADAKGAVERAATAAAVAAAAKPVGAFEPKVVQQAPMIAAVPVPESPPPLVAPPLNSAFSVASLASLGRRSDVDDLSRVDVHEIPDPVPEEPIRPAPLPVQTKDPASLVPYASLLPKMDIRKPNGQLDGDNERAPKFKPGSVLDADWTHKTNELGYGLENSFGYTLDDNGRLQRLMVSPSQFRGLGGGPTPGAVASLQLPARDAGAGVGGSHADSLQSARDSSPQKVGSITSMSMTIPPFQGAAAKASSRPQAQFVGTGGNSWAMAPFGFGQQPPRKTSSLSRPSKSVLKKNFVIAQPGPQNLFIDGRLLKKVMPPAQAVSSPAPASPRSRSSKRVVWGEGCVVAVLNLNTVALDETFVANPNEPVSPMERLVLRESDLQPSPVQVSLNSKFWDALSRQEQLESTSGNSSLQQQQQQRMRQAQSQADLAKQQEQAASAERARLFASKQSELAAEKQQSAAPRLAKDKAKGKASAGQGDVGDMSPPTGWVEYYSAEYQRHYWFSHETGESRWV